MARLTYTAWCCPRCLRVHTSPWRESWCPCDPAYALQPQALPGHGVTWTPMVALDRKELRKLARREVKKDG